MSYKLYDAEIEYLESTGTQYIDTGINADSNMGFSMTYSFTDFSKDVYPRVGAIRQIGSKYIRHHTTRWKDVGSDIQYMLPTFYKVLADATNKHTLVLDTVNSSIGYDGEFTTYSEAAFDCDLNYYLFARNNYLNGAASITCAKIKIYQVKIYSNGVLVRDFIPVRVGNVGYLFDRVSGQLFGNSGTGSFVLGPDVAPGRYANEIAFLESTGSQYIDTGVVGSSDLSVVLKCYYKASSSSLPNTGFILSSRVANSDRQYGIIHSYASNFRYGNAASNSWENPEGRVLIFDNTESHEALKVYDTDNNLITTLTAPVATFNNNLNIVLFGYNNNGTVGCTSNRIYSLKMYEGTTLVRDFIPVEYNNIGYLYDKVSGQFFANQGTGKFVLGHRAPRFDGKACARSYTRRQLMMEMGKPYDAEIEYLESSGTQYIDIGLYETSLITSEVTYKAYSQFNNYGNPIIGCSYTVAGRYYHVTLYSNRYYYGTNGSERDSGNAQYENKHTIIYNSNDAILNVDGLNVDSFKLTNSGYYNIYIGYRRANNLYSAIQIYEVKIYNKNVPNIPFIHLIPVRKDGVGYMYDKVSGQLFGNAGTGSFILGPDKH